MRYERLVLEGHGTPASGPVDGLPWYEPDSAITDGDPAAAIELLEEAGWVEGADGVRERDGVRAAFTIVYPSHDSTRQGLAVAVADMLAEIGLDVDVDGMSFSDIPTINHSTPVLYGWGSHDPTEMYNLYHSRFAGVESFNAGYYASEHVDRELDLAMAAGSQEEAIPHWRAAQLDDDGNGFTASADAAWAWLVNLDHTYYVDSCLDLGPVQIEPHGHGFPITAGLQHWRWTC